MLRYGFFDSEITGYDEEGLPIFDRAESSDFLAVFISCIISNGVLALPGDSFQVVAHEGMELRVRPGFGIIKGRFAVDEKEFAITVPDAHDNYMRRDRVVLRANYLQRKCEIVIKEGIPGADAVPPALLQPEAGDYYELCLAVIDVNSHQTVITQSSITDTRYDSRVCGAVTQVINHLDTSVLFAQLEQFYKEFVNRSDDSYNDFVAAMDEYLNSLKESGNSQMKEIVDIMTAFEVNAENSFHEWLQHIKGKLGEDIAGNLQMQIDEMLEKFDAIGELTQLETTNKETLVGAINELATDKADAAALEALSAAAYAQTITSYSDLMANSVEGYLADAVVVKEGFAALGGWSIYPDELTQGEYDALPEETKNTPKLIFVIRKE